MSLGFWGVDLQKKAKTLACISRITKSQNVFKISGPEDGQNPQEAVG